MQIERRMRDQQPLSRISLERVDRAWISMNPDNRTATTAGRYRELALISSVVPVDRLSTCWRPDIPPGKRKTHGYPRDPEDREMHACLLLRISAPVAESDSLWSPNFSASCPVTMRNNLRSLLTKTPNVSSSWYFVLSLYYQCPNTRVYSWSRA